MGKGKLAKFADMEAFENVFQYPFSVIDNVPFEMKGRWRDMYFNNSNPIVLELGCVHEGAFKRRPARIIIAGLRLSGVSLLRGPQFR